MKWTCPRCGSDDLEGIESGVRVWKQDASGKFVVTKFSPDDAPFRLYCPDCELEISGYLRSLREEDVNAAIEECRTGRM
jgi:rubredoxin